MTECIYHNLRKSIPFIPYLSEMKKQKVRWGIIGCGRIARKFAADLKLVKNATLTAVAARTLDNAKKFAKEFKVANAHGSYQDIVNNNEVDVIYIATPHSHHYEHTLLCLNHNKAVLCEKPFAMNSRQAKEMIRVAREKKIFLMEAVWTKFLPHYKKMQELIKKGKIGEVKSVLANFGFRLRPDAPVRLSDPALGGGTLLDIGIYNVFIALSILGRPDEIKATMTPSAAGVDEQCAVTFIYRKGAMAQLFSSFSTNLPTDVHINGTKAYIKLTSRFYDSSSKVELHYGMGDKGKPVKLKKEKGIGYWLEAKHVTDCLRDGLMESPVMSHNNTIELIEVLDDIRRIAGIKYAVD
jgi:predicted dehydrogenase